MAKKTRTYADLKSELVNIIDQLQDESIELDKALELYDEANKLTVEIGKYLQKSKHKFELKKNQK